MKITRKTSGKNNSILVRIYKKQHRKKKKKIGNKIKYRTTAQQKNKINEKYKNHYTCRKETKTLKTSTGRTEMGNSWNWKKNTEFNNKIERRNKKTGYTKIHDDVERRNK
jgi:hypothetical protein